MQPLQHYIENALAWWKSIVARLGVFGIVALGLAAVGIYGVMSYGVSQRSHEIGIRMALGAQPHSVLGIAISQGLRLVGIGVALGMAAAVALTHLMSSLFFNVSAVDPVTFVGVTLLTTFVSLAACYIPARRAMRVDHLLSRNLAIAAIEVFVGPAAANSNALQLFASYELTDCFPAET